MANKVLVVDDEPDIIDSLKIDLELQGYRVLTALDGRKALEIASREIPDLIVLDLVLPVLDGYGVLKQLRADRRCRKIPVLVISARSDAEGLSNSLDWGDADRYYGKPLQLDVLHQLIQNMMEKSKVER